MFITIIKPRETNRGNRAVILPDDASRFYDAIVNGIPLSWLEVIIHNVQSISSIRCGVQHVDDMVDGESYSFTNYVLIKSNPGFYIANGYILFLDSASMDLFMKAISIQLDRYSPDSYEK